MSRLIIATLLVTIALLSSPLTAADSPDLQKIEKQFGKPALSVLKPKAPPVIDGQLDDACWKDAPPITLGYTAGMWWDPPTQKTEARVLADDKAIYFAVRCFEHDAERIAADGTVRKGMIEKADAVEFFLDPGCHCKRFEYYHVIVTAGGKVLTGRGLETDAWKPTIQAKTAKVDKGWTAEVAVPLET